MKTVSPFALVVVLALARLAPATTAAAAQSEAPEPAEPAESRVRHGTNGEVLIVLDAATQQRMGLQLATGVATNLPPEAKGYGRVLDPGPLLALMTELAQAHVAAAASRQEFERLQVLRAQDNTSERAVQAGEAAAARDRLTEASLRTRLRLEWGSRFVEPAFLDATAQALAEGGGGLVRIDLPVGAAVAGTPRAVRLESLRPEAKALTGEYLGPAPHTLPQFQGQGYLFLVRQDPPPPGTALTGLIQTDGSAVSGWLIPREGVVRESGRNWIWVQTAADTYARREVKVSRASGEGYFVESGFAEGTRLVTTGAQALLSEERKGVGGED